MLPDVPETTVDRLEGLDLSVVQPARGYRFAVDALLLAFFASRFDPFSFVDAGAGCGICSLALMRHSSRSRQATLFEIQSELAVCARQNLYRNAPRNVTWSVRTEDVRYAMIGDPVDLVLSNPPYRSPAEGRVSPVAQRALARHGFRLSPADMTMAASGLLKPDGVACIIVPPGVAKGWRDSFRTHGFSLLVRCPVFSKKGGPEVLTLMAFGRSVREVATEPLVLRDTTGNYTPTARFIMGIV